MEKSIVEMTQIAAIEAPTKEAIYALDDTSPLYLFDCLKPEIHAYRPLKLPLSNYKKRLNYEAML